MDSVKSLEAFGEKMVEMCGGSPMRAVYAAKETARGVEEEPICAMPHRERK